MNDHELLDAAAKAAGITPPKAPPIHSDGWMSFSPWNPLRDDGDALRLAVKLSISVEQDASIETGTFTFNGVTEGEYSTGVEVWVVRGGMQTVIMQEIYGTDKYASSRRAIVRAAAAMAAV